MGYANPSYYSITIQFLNSKTPRGDYFFGGFPQELQITALLSKTFIPKSVIIKSVYLLAFGTPDLSADVEVHQLHINLYRPATGYTVDRLVGFVYDWYGYRCFSNDSLDLFVDAGDLLEFRLTVDEDNYGNVPDFLIGHGTIVVEVSR